MSATITRETYLAVISMLLTDTDVPLHKVRDVHLEHSTIRVNHFTDVLVLDDTNHAVVVTDVIPVIDNGYGT